MFYVVQLDSDIFKEKIVVPSIWLDKYNTLCLLPPITDAAKVDTLAKAQFMPKHGWQMHSLSFIQSFDTYSQAKEYITKGKPVMIELEKEEEEEHHKEVRGKRKRKLPRFLEQYFIDSDPNKEEDYGTKQDDCYDCSTEDDIVSDPLIVKIETTEDSNVPQNHQQSQLNITHNKSSSSVHSSLQHGSQLQVPGSSSTTISEIKEMALESSRWMSKEHGSLAVLPTILDHVHSKLSLGLTPPPSSESVIDEKCSNCSHLEKKVKTMELEIVSLKRILMDNYQTTNNILTSINKMEKQDILQRIKDSQRLKTTKELATFSEKLKDNEAFSKMKMNTDPRGVKRGSCLSENCDCTLYEYEGNSGPKCSYCFCPPTKHQKMEESVDITSDCTNAEAIAACSDNGDSHQQGPYSLQDLIPVSTNTITSQLCSPQLQGLLPKKLPKQVEVALANKSLTPVLRNRIVRVIADKCFEENVSSQIIDNVAELAVEKWSPLKDRYGKSPSSGLAKQVKRRMSKLRLRSKKQEETHSQANSNLDRKNAFYEERMASEMRKSSPSVLKLKQFLDATRTMRKEKVNSTPALTIMVLYPALKKPDLLLWEFTKLINVPEECLIQRWKDFIDAMKDYLRKTEHFIPLEESYESLTLEILQKLPNILPSGKRTNDMRKFILQIFEDNTALESIVPDKTDPPRLIAIENIKGDIMLFSYIDGVAIFSEKCPVKAVLLLLATYWVYNIEFVAESRPAFLLISTAVLREMMPTALLSKCSAVNGLLNQLNL